MIQLGGFSSAKEIARLPFGRGARDQFSHHVDPRKRWETTLDPRVALDLIGTFSASPGAVPDVWAWLGDLTAEERQFKVRFAEVYERAAALTTTVPVVLDLDADLCETLLDTRIIQRHVAAPRRVLDIGPGAGRHLLNAALRPFGAASAYVGVESVGLPYLLQNIVGTTLAMGGEGWQFVDQVDFDLARLEAPPARELESRCAWHVPLWRADLIPSRSFDLVICNYVLDELSPSDLDRIVALVTRCLTDDGVLYCRGGQQRSMFKNLYLFRHGTFHQRDITATLLERGLHVKTCELIGSTITRVFAPTRRSGDPELSEYAALRSDADLVGRLQRDYVAAAVASFGRSARVLIWADPGYHVLGPLIEQHLPELQVVGMTNEHIMQEGVGPFGLRQIPLSRVPALRTDALLIAGFRTELAVRELREALGRDAIGPVRQFNMPFAYARITPPEMP